MEIILAYDNLEEVLELVKEYTDMLLQHGDELKECLKSQNIDDELKDLQRKYALPDGRLYLARIDGKTAGCVGLTRNDDEYCELKRLYIRPEFRGKHLSKTLIEKVIDDAKSIGYKYMRLDTFPFMNAAVKLYEKYGFEYIENYNDNPAKTALFMQMNL